MERTLLTVFILDHPWSDFTRMKETSPVTKWVCLRGGGVQGGPKALHAISLSYLPALSKIDMTKMCLKIKNQKSVLQYHFYGIKC